MFQLPTGGISSKTSDCYMALGWRGFKLCFTAHRCALLASQSGYMHCTRASCPYTTGFGKKKKKQALRLSAMVVRARLKAPSMFDATYKLSLCRFSTRQAPLALWRRRGNDLAATEPQSFTRVSGYRAEVTAAAAASPASRRST